MVLDFPISDGTRKQLEHAIGVLCHERGLSTDWVLRGPIFQSPRSYVYRLVGPDTPFPLVAKVFASDSAEVQHTAMVLLERELMSCQYCSTPRPFGVLPQWQTAIMEFVEGESLEKTVVSYTIPRQSLLAVLRATGRGLTALHRLAGGVPVRHTSSDELDKLVRLWPESKEQPTWIKKSLRLLRETQQLHGNEGIPVGRLHGDLKPSNVLFRDDLPVFIDTASKFRSRVALDLAHFLNHLSLSTFSTLSPAMCMSSKRLEDAFLQGYITESGELDRASLGWYRLANLILVRAGVDTTGVGALKASAVDLAFRFVARRLQRDLVP